MKHLTFAALAAALAIGTMAISGGATAAAPSAAASARPAAGIGSAVEQVHYYHRRRSWRPHVFLHIGPWYFYKPYRHHHYYRPYGYYWKPYRYVYARPYGYYYPKRHRIYYKPYRHYRSTVPYGYYRWRTW